MPDWVRAELAVEDLADAELDGLRDLVMIAEINQRFHLREPLHRTAARPWWDLLGWNLALHAQRQMEARARANSGV